MYELPLPEAKASFDTESNFASVVPLFVSIGAVTHSRKLRRALLVRKVVDYSSHSSASICVEANWSKWS